MRDERLVEGALRRAGVRQRGAALFEAQRVLRGDGVGRFACREGADDGGASPRRSKRAFHDACAHATSVACQCVAGPVLQHPAIHDARPLPTNARVEMNSI